MNDKTRQSLADDALTILTAIWDWDYRHWEHIEDLVTGPLARILKANLTDEEVAPSKTLLALTIASQSFEEDGTAKVQADYLWQEGEGAPVPEHIMWIFLHEDGRWKAATLGR